MGESDVSVDGVTHPVPLPFMVVATQNPVDLDGTYALPEAQLDRSCSASILGIRTRTPRWASSPEGRPARASGTFPVC